ncbi:MAG TPA: response regulator [Thermoanaerobaculia bacterium]|nr:response regulator [Thermoanaerobaculia bacterium]
MSSEPRVLIVEHNDALRVLLFTILRHQPLQVDTAVSTDEALEKVLSCDYALIVVDMDLPDEAGQQFVSAFREARPEATTFILAVRDPNADSYLDAAQVNALMNKPLEIDTLAELVRECAMVIPPPEDPLHCPPSESEVRMKLERGSYIEN